MEKKPLTPTERSARWRENNKERQNEHVRNSTKRKKERIEKTIAYLKALLDEHGIPYDTVI